MSSVKTSASVLFRKSTWMHKLILVISVLMPLAGCSNDGAGGPVVSSLSTPTDDSADLDSDQTLDSESTDPDGEEDPIITMIPTSTGVTAHLTWAHPPHMNVAGYNVYYRKQPSPEPPLEESGSEEPASVEPSLEESSSEQPSSCSSGESQAVAAAAATITGLEPNTPYIFAIRAFNENESESLCSNEIMAVTPSAQS